MLIWVEINKKHFSLIFFEDGYFSDYCTYMLQIFTYHSSYIYMEGTVSQIVYICSSLHLTECRKLVFKKYQNISLFFA